MTATAIGKRGQKIAPEKKSEAIAWLKSNPGRGSLRTASEKFGISYATLSKWAGDAGLGKKASKKAVNKSRKTSDNLGNVVEFQGGLFIDAKQRKNITKALEALGQALTNLKQSLGVS